MRYTPSSNSNTPVLTLVGIGSLLLLLLITSCSAKSYSIQRLSSEITVRDGSCALDIVESFEYEFVGSYSVIGRALGSDVTDVYGVSIKLLSKNGFIALCDVVSKDLHQFIVITLSPSTVNTETTRISFQLSYSISSSSKKLFYKDIGANYYLLSFHYKDNSTIHQLNSTFYFDPSISFTHYPEASPSFESKLLNDRTIQFRTFNTSDFTPSFTFTTKDNIFDKCSTFIEESEKKQKSYSSNLKSSSNLTSSSGLDASIIVPIVIVPLIGLFMIISLMVCLFLSVKYPKHPIIVKFSCTLCSRGGSGKVCGSDDNNCGTTRYIPFNDKL